MAKKSKKKEFEGETEIQSLGVSVDPLRRIKDVTQARELWVRLYLENRKRAEVYAQVRNQIEGGRPFDPVALHQNGEDWRTNVNFRDAEAAFNRAFFPYWRMVHEVPRKAAFKIYTGSPDAPKWEIQLGEIFDRWIDDCGPDYYHQFQGTTRDFVKYGPGFAMWEDSKNPRFKWAPTVQIYFPKRTKTNVDEWELVAVKREMTASELWEHCSPEERDKAAYAGWNTSATMKAIQSVAPKRKGGWSPDAIGKAIANASPNPSQNQYYDPNYYQDLIINNDLVIGGIWPPVVVIDIWAKDKSGKICHYIFTEKSDVNEYLYMNEEEATSFREIFGPIYYDIGENGLIHSVKGFAVKNYYYATSLNAMKCRVMDAGVFSMGMNFVRSEEANTEAPSVENYSMVNIFPQGLEQLQYFPQIQNVQSVMQMLKQNQDENNYTYNEVSSNIAKSDTAKQAEILASIGQEMSTAVSTTYLTQVGKNIYAECFRRLRMKGNDNEDAKKFRKRCLDSGIPEEVLNDAEISVATGASPTMASPLVREQVANTLMAQIYPLPNANKRAIEEFRVSNLTGADGVSRFLLNEGVNSSPEARRQAQQENVDFGQGHPLDAIASDAHVEHLDEHLKPLEAIVQNAQQGANVTPDQLVAMQITLPHIDQHLQMLSTDKMRVNDFKQLKARASNVMSIAGGIMQRLQGLQDRQMTQSADVQPDQVAAALQGPAR